MRLWKASIIDGQGFVWQERFWLVWDTGFNINPNASEATLALWNEHLEAVKDKVRNSHEFPSREILPHGYCLSLDIVEFDAKGVAVLP